MIAIVALALAGALPMAQLEADPSAPYWNQSQGNACASSGVDVAPMEATPSELWRRSDLELASKPVIWGSTIYLVTEESGRHTLLALDARTGEKQASASLGRMADANYRLAVWHDMVIAANKEELRGFAHKATTLRKRWSKDVGTHGGLCLDRGVIYTNSTDMQLHAFGTEKGTLFGSGAGGWGRPAVSSTELITLFAGEVKGRQGTQIQVNTCFPPQPGTLKRKGDWTPLIETRMLGPLGKWADATPEETVIACAEGYAAATYLGLGQDPRASAASFQEFYGTRIRGGAAATWDHLYGFGADGLIKQSAKGESWALLPAADLPPGAKRGPLSRAGDVLYAGNMGFDIERGRVLWVLEGLDLASTLIPLGDESGLLVTTDGALVAVTSGQAGGSASAAAQVPALAPDAGPGIVLATGEVVLGAVAMADAVTVTPEGGAPQVFATGEVAVLLPGEPSAKPQLLGDEYAIVMAWNARIGEAKRDRQIELFGDYRKSKLVADCNRLLEQMQRLHPATKQELIASLGGVRQSSAANAGLKRERVGKDELECLGADAKARLAAATWCRGAGLDGAATLLVTSAQEASEQQRDFWRNFGYKGARPPEEPAAIAVPADLELDKLLPANFPLDAWEIGPLWGQWAGELLPASARFTDASEPGYPKLVTGTWTQETLALRTNNMVLLSRCIEPEILGPVLRYAEGALRLLDGVFGKQSPADAPLEVRLHKNRDDYIAESEISRSIGQWTLGYYSPAERVSRFFVPEDTAGSASAVEQKLHEVVVHELTHQYISERAGYDSVLDPRVEGHWIVEGFARFIEQQAVELGRNGRGLTDHTVLSIDLCSRLLEEDALIPMEKLLRTTNLSFQDLGKDGGIPVKPRYAVGTYTVSETSQYYSQAGALCFFLMNRRGEEGPTRVLDYLEARYEARLPKDHVKLLGFESIPELDAAFRGFLANPAAQ